MTNSLKPLISVVLPNYNDGETLERAINAILSQSYENIELVTVDDGSTDNSRDILAKLARLDNRLKVIYNEGNKGALWSVNRGLRECRGKYLCFQAADDKTEKDFFFRAIELGENHEGVGIIFGKMALVDSNGGEIYNSGVAKWNKAGFYSREQYLRDCLMAEPPMHSWHAATIYRMLAFKEFNPFRPELATWADTFVARAVGLKHGVCYLPKVCVKCLLSPQTLSGAMSRNWRMSWGLCDKVAAAMREPRMRSVFPEEYVSRWLWSARLNVAGAMVFRLLSAGKISHLKPGSLLFRFLYVIFRAVAPMARGVAAVGEQIVKLWRGLRHN